MDLPKPSHERIAQSSAGLAFLTGAYGFLTMMGAFGPVSCWTATTSSQTASESGGVTSSEGTVTRGCEAGIDYLFGSTGGNAPVLFFWAVVLLSLVTIGSVAAWTGRRFVAWVTVGVSVFISIIGAMSIGWLFVLPALLLLVAATALTVEARRETDGERSTTS